ncbi:protein phosphatase 1 regulatory subunit 3B [Aplochiton taeniatus]
MSTMSVDLDRPFYLSKELCCRKTPTPCQPCLNPCLRLEHTSLPRQVESTEEVTKDNSKLKKNVSFADHRGLPLTMVKHFSEFSDPIGIPLNIQRMFNFALTLGEKENKLVLDFVQPSSDYLMFRQRLQTDHVCLEHCVLKERALVGTVKVKNLSFVKSVKVRVTFDTWKSSKDVDCKYVKDTFTDSDRDTFCFEVFLPAWVNPSEHIEFAICYEANSSTYWDSNQGQNYKIIWSSMKGGALESTCITPQRNSLDMGIHFDRFGSPRCSHGIFPEWPSYAGYENIGPYY